MKRTHLIRTLFLVISLVSESHGGDFSVHADLSFSGEVPELKLDLFVPQGGSGPVPCVVAIQGGGFLPQDGKRFRPFAERLAENGIAAALIAYRGRPEYTYRETLKDVWSSIDFLRSQASRFRLDPDQFGVTGRSAGGTLAALVAIRGSKDGPRKEIQAAVCFAGVYDFVSRFTREEQLALQPRSKVKIRTNGEWIGSEFAIDDPDWLAASAANHCHKKMPPIMLLHSKDDPVVPWQQSRDMHDAVKDAGANSELNLYETGGHGVTPENIDTLDVMTSFFQEHLGLSNR
ncbi:MAG: alpha/beta hydrolase [Planctomycetota bacterium]